MASTKVEIRDNRELRRVEAIDGEGEVAGYAEYQISVDGTTFDFHHTKVDERFEGHGVGSQLAAGVMEFARGEGITIQPTCSFIRSYMDKHEETNDLRAPDPSDEADEDQAEDQDSDQDSDEGDTEDTGSEDQSDESESDQDEDDQDDQDDEDDEDSADEDSPDAGPADAKAAGSGGATDEEDSRA